MMRVPQQTNGSRSSVGNEYECTQAHGRARTALWWTWAVLGATGCGVSVQRPPVSGRGDTASMAITTDQTQYHSSSTTGSSIRRLTIGATLTNPLSRPIFVVLCQGSALEVLEKRTPDGWRIAYAPVCHLEEVTPREIGPGQKRRDVASLWVPAKHSEGEPDVPLRGTYRIRYSVYTRFEGTGPSHRVERAPDTVSLSNEFTIDANPADTQHR